MSRPRGREVEAREMIQYIYKNPNADLSEMSRVFGICREQVSLVLREDTGSCFSEYRKDAIRLQKWREDHPAFKQEYSNRKWENSRFSFQENLRCKYGIV